MDLPESLTLERYRLAIDRQKYFTGVAREAFATYAKFTAGIAAAGITLISARESFGLDATLMPDLIAVLAYVLTFLAAVAAVQILVAMARWRRHRRIAELLDPGTPPIRPFWWLAEATYLLVIAASVVAGWRVLGGIAGRFLGGS